MSHVLHLFCVCMFLSVCLLISTESTGLETVLVPLFSTDRISDDVFCGEHRKMDCVLNCLIAILNSLYQSQYTMWGGSLM